MNKRTIRVGYLCTNTITIGGSYYTSNGYFQTREEKMHCDGLKTDCSNLKFTLQDFEQLIDIEKQYKPEDKESIDKTYGEESGTTIEKYVIANNVVEALNNAFSETYCVLFTKADNKNELLYSLSEIVGCEEYQEIENTITWIAPTVRKELLNLDKQIQKLGKQIKTLQNNREQLERTIPLKKYAKISTSLKAIIGNQELDVNALIPHYNVYPLDIAFLIKDKELLECLLKAGACKLKDSRHKRRSLSALRMGSWYGFFKFWKESGSQTVDIHLIIKNMYLLPDDIIINIFTENNKSVMYEDINLSAIFFKDIRKLISNLYDKRTIQKTEKDLYDLFEQLILSKRYNVISVITDFLFEKEWYCDYNEILFACCVKHQDLESLKNLHPVILSDYFHKSEYNINQFYNMNYLGAEMMEYIEANIFK